MNQVGIKPTVILVVDDEPIIRLDAVAMMEDAGFAVIEAADAEEALAVMTTNGDVSVLFTDINMPGPFDGLELARQVHDRWPAVQLVITSGRVMLSQNEIPDHGHFIAKPYQTTAVLALLKSIS